MLFSRYGGAVTEVFQYDFEFGIRIINKAMEKKVDENMYQRWLCGYEKKMSFPEFKNELKKSAPPTKHQFKEKTEKETFDTVRKILEMR